MQGVRARGAVASCSTTHGLGATGGRAWPSRVASLTVRRVGDKAPVPALTAAAHCHPTEQVRGASAEAVEAWLNEAAAVPLQRFCAMSTDQQDQPLVEALVQRLGDKVVPCFGALRLRVRPADSTRLPPLGGAHDLAQAPPATRRGALRGTVWAR